MSHSDTTASFVRIQIIELQPPQLPYGAVETNLQSQSEGAKDWHRKGRKIKRHQMRPICVQCECRGSRRHGRLREKGAGRDSWKADVPGIWNFREKPACCALVLWEADSVYCPNMALKTEHFGSGGRYLFDISVSSCVSTLIPLLYLSSDSCQTLVCSSINIHESLSWRV